MTVIAIDEYNNIITTNEYAYALGNESLELISGGIDEWEDPLECAKRELQEEAWIIAEKWISLGYIDPFTSIINSRNYIFLAKKLQKTKENPDEWEIVNLWKISYEEALEKVLNSEIYHGASVVAILKAKEYLS